MNTKYMSASNVPVRAVSPQLTVRLKEKTAAVTKQMPVKGTNYPSVS